MPLNLRRMSSQADMERWYRKLQSQKTEENIADAVSRQFDGIAARVASYSERMQRYSQNHGVQISYTETPVLKDLAQQAAKKLY